jgi:DNA repair protein RecO (recombination protein O)
MIAETKAIVLHTRKFSDTSKIATLFTSDFGKISVIAKGAAKPKSKFGSSLDPLSYINISFIKKILRDYIY